MPATRFVMTDRERVLAAIAGEVPDRLPFVPRLEFWHRAHCRRGTLPPEVQDLSLMEISDLLGCGHYAVVPDFTDPCGEDMDDRAMGIIRLPVLPYRITMEGVDRRVVHSGAETSVEYRTPEGVIRTVMKFTDQMLDAGASDPWIVQHAIGEPADFAPAGFIFSHLKVEPRPEGYEAARTRVGERGIVVGFASSWACPLQHIMMDLMGTEKFFYALHDCPEAIERLAEQMEPFYESLKRITLDSSAEVVLLGSNYDDSITHPAFFRKYLLPPLCAYAAELHRRGKFLMTHTDGENRRLLPVYLETGFDVADSVCPYPMTHCRIEEILNVFAGRITVWGGIPSVLLCPESASFDQLRAFVDSLVDGYGRRSGLILGVSDMVTADADWGRVKYISKKLSGTN
jgi:hypothetical protein